MNSETRNKLRKLMKTCYAAMKLIDFHCQLSKTPMYFAAEYLSAGLVGQIQRTPWQVFHTFKPEINERRAKAWHRLESYKRKKDIAYGKTVVIASLDKNQMFTGKQLSVVLNNVTI
jgi:hypothetical protein